MNDDGLIELLRRHRPAAPAGLRARILAAAAARLAPPWWARVRTWAALAAALLIVDLAVIDSGRIPQPPTPAAATRPIPADLAGLPPLLLARLDRDAGPTIASLMQENPP